MDIELIRVDETAKAEAPLLSVQRQLQANIRHINDMYLFSQGYKPKCNYQAPRYSFLYDTSPLPARGYTPTWCKFDEIKPENESVWRKIAEGIRSVLG